eukprot:9253856-Alexandrium_andersonii.AAC.1
MTPNPPDEALEGEISGCFRPPSAHATDCGLCTDYGLLRRFRALPGASQHPNLPASDQKCPTLF